MRSENKIDVRVFSADTNWQLGSFKSPEGLAGLG
jgi:hypothetical protein